MSMYCGYMLTPTEANIAPSNEQIVALTKWFIEKGDAQPPSPSNPITTTIWLQDEEPPYEMYPEDYNFATLDETLLAFFDEHAEWVLDLQRTGRGFLYEKVVPPSTFSELLEFTEATVGWNASLNRIELVKGDVREYLSFSDILSPAVVRHFAIQFHSDTKANPPLDDYGATYGTAVWERVKNSDRLRQVEEILGFKLEGYPFIF